MTLPSLATVEDLAARLPGGIATADEDRAQAVLDDVSALIRAEAETDWLDDEGALDDVPDVVVTVTLAAARRAWLNPDGKVSETIGSYSYRVGDAGGVGVMLTEEEKRLVRRAGGVVAAAVANVELNPDTTITDLVYADVEGSDWPIPVGGSLDP